MSDRSYLFSAPKLPAPTGDLPRPIRGISQYNWSIPWVHMVLVSVDTQICPSMIWDRKIAIAGDYAGGVERLTTMVRGAKLSRRMRNDADQALEFLHDRKSQQRWLVLEAGEILAVLGGDLEKEAEALLSEINLVEPDEAPPDEHAGFDGYWSHSLFHAFR